MRNTFKKYNIPQYQIYTHVFILNKFTHKYVRRHVTLREKMKLF